MLQSKLYTYRTFYVALFKLLFNFCSNSTIRCFAAAGHIRLGVAEMMGCAYPHVSRSENDAFPRTFRTQDRNTTHMPNENVVLVQGGVDAPPLSHRELQKR